MAQTKFKTIYCDQDHVSGFTYLLQCYFCLGDVENSLVCLDVVLFKFNSLIVHCSDTYVICTQVVGQALSRNSLSTKSKFFFLFILS